MTVAPVDGDAAVIDRHGMALDLGPDTLSRGCGDRLQLHYTVGVLAERHAHTTVQANKMTTASTADLLHHSRTGSAADDSGTGTRADAMDTTPTSAGAGVPAGTSRTRPTVCTRGAGTAHDGSSEPAA